MTTADGSNAHANDDEFTEAERDYIATMEAFGGVDPEKFKSIFGHYPPNPDAEDAPRKEDEHVEVPPPEYGEHIMPDDEEHNGDCGNNGGGHGKGSNGFDDHKPRGKPLRFKLEAFDDIDVDDDAEYIVEGLLPRAAMTIIWGPPKCGKSFWFLDLLLHVALGWQYRGRDVEQGAVVYLALEGGRGFKKRIAAFKRYHSGKLKSRVPFYLVTVPVDLVKDYPALIEAVRAQLPGGVSPIVVAIDTLNRSISGSESKDADMTAYVRAADVLRDEFGCAVPVIHHCGHDDTRMRGFSGLQGALDAEISVARDAADNIVATVQEMKDDENGTFIVSRLSERIEVGKDRKGRPKLSCVVEPVEGAPAAKTDAARKGRPSGPSAFRQAFNEAIGMFGQSIRVRPEPNAPLVEAVEVRHVREAFREFYVTGKAGKEVQQASRDRTFLRLLGRLPTDIGQGTIQEVEWLWLMSGKSDTTGRNRTDEKPCQKTMR